jgi:cupin 2 domain-containing protein
MVSLVAIGGQSCLRFQRDLPPEPRKTTPHEPLTNLPQNLPAEITTVLQEGNGVRIERIVSTGHRSPEGFWYDQPEHDWVMVLTGVAKLAFDDRVVELLPGDSINIPANQRHRVEWTSPDEPTVWLAVLNR